MMRGGDHASHALQLRSCNYNLQVGKSCQSLALSLYKQTAFVTCSTVVSRVSVHWRLNITRVFGLHGRLPRLYLPYVYIEAATLTP
jgi:hypothetical protein